MKIWQFQEAKTKFNHLIRNVLTKGRKFFLKKTKNTFNEFMNKSPLMGLDLDFSRNKSPCREIEL